MLEANLGFGARVDADLGILAARREADENVVGVGGGGDDDIAGRIDTGLFEAFLLERAADDVQCVGARKVGFEVGIFFDHHRRHPVTA